MKTVGFISKQFFSRKEVSITLFLFMASMTEKYFQNPFDDYSKEAAKEIIENNLVTRIDCMKLSYSYIYMF